MEPISPATSGHGRSCLESIHGGKASSDLTERVLMLLSMSVLMQEWMKVARGPSILTFLGRK